MEIFTWWVESVWNSQTEIVEVKCELSSTRLDIAEKRISKLNYKSIENILKHTEQIFFKGVGNT